MIRDPRFHRRRHAERLMHAPKVIVHMKQRDHGNVIVEFFTESVRQASEAPHVHSHIEILAFHVAGRSVLRVTDDRRRDATEALRRAVARLGFAYASYISTSML